MAPTPRKRQGSTQRDAPAPRASAPHSADAEATLEPSRRRIVVTGANGFVGRAVCRALHERGDQVVALVRDPDRASGIADLGAEGLELVADDLLDLATLTEHVRETDAVIHAAGRYRVGIPRSERGAMWDANVGATTSVLDAAEAAGVPRVVYISTCNVFGDTHGEVVDEAYRRDLRDGFRSWYDETKYGAHEVAEQRIASGAPVVIVLPSQVYGPGDRSELGEQLRDASLGRLRYRVLDDVGLGFVHVNDLAAGLVAALDRGRVGESYVLSGPPVRVAAAIEAAAAAGGHRPPSLRIPTGILRALGPIGALVGQPNLQDLVAAGAGGVTYWASSAKAERELGFRARDLETGFRDTFGRP